MTRANGQLDSMPAGEYVSIVGLDDEGKVVLGDNSNALVTATGGVSKTVADWVATSPLGCTFLELGSLVVPPVVKSGFLWGYYLAGDIGAHNIARVTSQPSAGGVRSADRYLPNGTVSNANGGWWQIQEIEPYVEMFGAKADGITDDSAAFTEALGYSARIFCRRGKIYVIKDLVLDSKIIDANGAVFDIASGAKWGIRVTGYEPQLLNLTIRDSIGAVVKSTSLSANVLAGSTSFSVANASALEVGMLATILMDNARWHISPITNIVSSTITIARGFETTATSGAVVDCSWGMINERGATRSLTENLKFLNASFGLVSDAPSGLTYINNRNRKKNITFESVRHVGAFSGRNCADSRWDDIVVRGGGVQLDNFAGNGVTAIFNITKAVWLKSELVVTVNGVPQVLGTNYNFNSTTQIQFTGGSIPANGAAIVANAFYYTKSGLVIDATGWTVLRGGDFYGEVECLGFLRGIEIRAKELTSFDRIISDTISGEAMIIDACTSIAGILGFSDVFLAYTTQPLIVSGSSVGVQFSGPFFTSRAPTADLVSGVVAASSIDVGSGSIITIEAPGFSIISDKVTSGSGAIYYPGSMSLQFADPLTVAAGTTVYYGPGGYGSTDRAVAPVLRPMRIKRFLCLPSNAPGGGQTYTYTVRINGVDTTAIAVISGAGSFSAELTNLNIAVAFGQSISVSLVTSASAAVGSHRFIVELI